jgi:CheY-like chemotaxis protein
MPHDVTFSPVSLATKHGLEDAQLVLVEGGILAILVHAESEESWYLQAGFGSCETEGILFPDLGAAEAWVQERLQKHANWVVLSRSDQLEPHRDEAPSRLLRILIVEDNSLHALYLESHIGQLGYEVVDTVASGPQAIAAAATHHPDLVFMDVQLAGGTDGIAAARTIHERFGIPSVFVTGLTDPATRARMEQVIRSPADGVGWDSRNLGLPIG